MAEKNIKKTEVKKPKATKNVGDSATKPIKKEKKKYD